MKSGFFFLLFFLLNLSPSYSIISMEQVSSFSNITTMDYSTSIDIEGDYAYITGFNTASLAIIDFSDKSNPRQVGYFINRSSLDGAWYIDVDTKGDYAYIGGDGGNNLYNGSLISGLVILNVTNKSNPYQVSILADMDDIYSLKISDKGYGNLIYLTSQQQGYLYIINVTDKKNPGKLGNISISRARSVVVDDKGGYAYVGTNDNIPNNITEDYVYIINISNKTNPINITNLNNFIFFDLQAIYLEGDYIYTSAWPRDDLTITNIKDKKHPYIQTIFKHPAIYGVMDLRAHNDMVYMASEYANSVVIINVSNKDNPVLIGHFCNTTSLYYPYEIEIAGDFIHLASKFGNSYTILKMSQGDGDLPLYNNSRCYNERPTENRVGQAIPDFDITKFLIDNTPKITHPSKKTFFSRWLDRLMFWK